MLPPISREYDRQPAKRSPRSSELDLEVDASGAPMSERTTQRGAAERGRRSLGRDSPGGGAISNLYAYTLNNPTMLR